MPVNFNWAFPTQPNNNHGIGPANLALQLFGGQREYASIVREAIQNSLDAARSVNEPVKVVFSFGKIDLERYPDTKNVLDSALKHIELIINDKGNNDGPKSAFKEMRNVIMRFKSLKRLPFFKIADYGTTGLYHNVEEPNLGKMCDFMHEDGKNNPDNNNGGGANGIGKMAYFALSPLNMVLASAYALPERNAGDEEARAFFSGAMKLITHPCPETPGVKYQYAGYIPEIPSDKIYNAYTYEDLENLPFIFSRKANINAGPELGTSFFIMGMEPEGLNEVIATTDYDANFNNRAGAFYKDNLLKPILQNYFVAIANGKLEVELGMSNQDATNIKINQENIEIHLKTVWENMAIMRRNNFNPRPFIKSLSNNDEMPNNDEACIHHFELDIDSLESLKIKKYDTHGLPWGKVRLHIYKDDALGAHSIKCMRAPLMVVDEFRTSNNRGSYAALLICDEECNFANQLLRAMEPATHDKWDYKLADSQGHGESRETAEAFLTELKSWVDAKLEELFPVTNSGSEYTPLRDILPYYNSEDSSQIDRSLLDADALAGETTKISIGKNPPKRDKDSNVSNVEIKRVCIGGDGSDATGGDGPGGGGGGGSVTNPRTPVTPDPDGRVMPAAREIPVRFRSFANKDEDGNYEYTIILSGKDADYERVDLGLSVSGYGKENENLQIAKIIEGPRGVRINGSKIHGLSIKKNEPTRLKLRFKLASRAFSLIAKSTIEIAKESVTQNVGNN